MKRLFNRKDKNNTSSSTTTPNGGSSGDVTNPPLPLNDDASSSQVPPSSTSNANGISLPPTSNTTGVSRPSTSNLNGFTLPPPPSVRNVGPAIGWSVAMPEFDFPYLLSLSDYLNTNSQACRDAAKALRTEFKHGQPIAQERAVRLVGVLMANCDHRFKEQVASKKFLGDLTDLVSSKKTEPRVKEMVYRVLSPLAYEYQYDSDLRTITQTFNKLLSTPSTALTSFPNSLDPSLEAFQPNGAPLDPQDPLLTPTGLLPSSNSRRRHHRNAQRTRGNRDEDDEDLIPIELEKIQMKELGERSEKARGIARLLHEAIVFSKEGDLTGNEMIEEFHGQCLEEQEFLTENLDWASVQAEKSRTTSTSNTNLSSNENELSGGGGGDRTTMGLASNNPFADAVAAREEGQVERGGRGGAGKTEEEEVLAKMLNAHSEISDVLALLSRRMSTARYDLQHSQDLQTATELSKTQIKGGGREGGMMMGGAMGGSEWKHERDRSYGEGGSGSNNRVGGGGYQFGEGEQQEAQEREDERTTAKIESKKPREGYNPYANYLSSPTNEPSTIPHNNNNGSLLSEFDTIPQSQGPSTTTTTSPYDGLGALEGLQGLDFGSPSVPSSSSTSAPPPVASSAPQRTSFPPTNPYASLSSLNTSGIPPHLDDSTTTSNQITESPISSTFLPNQPSEKALGKLRRISTSTVTGGGDHSSESRQRVLEEELRNKYRRNLEERENNRVLGGGGGGGGTMTTMGYEERRGGEEEEEGGIRAV